MDKEKEDIPEIDIHEANTQQAFSGKPEGESLQGTGEKGANAEIQQQILEKLSNIKEIQKVDFLLEKEKEKVEDDLIKELNEIHTESKKEVITAKTKTKKELVDKFMELQEAANNIKFTRAVLNKMRKDDIIKNIANYANDTITTTPSNELEKGETPLPNKPEGGQDARALYHLDSIATAMFNINLAVVNMAEGASGLCKNKTNGIDLLEGWSKSVIDKKEAFMTIFKLIYADYKMDIDKYLSPVVQYAIIMSQSAAEVLIKNVAKKKDTSDK